VALLVVGWGLSSPSPCQAAGIGIFLTARDRSHPVLLSETGLPIPLRSLAHPDPVLPQGTVPAYLAFPLSGGEHLPSSTPALTASPQTGQAAIGPLDLNPLVQDNLNAALYTSGRAVVKTSSQNYAVEFLPRYARTHAGPGSAAATPPASGGQTTAPTASGGQTTAPTAQTTPTIDGIPASQLSQWLNAESNRLVHWTSIGVVDLEKTLNIGNSNPTATKPSLNLAAQELLPPPSAESALPPLPPPIPEPSTWLVFGLILGAAGLRQWAAKAA
jgi:hypothetical protein